MLSNNPTWSGLGHGLLILTALWWAWAAYAWLTNDGVDVGAVWGAIWSRWRRCSSPRWPSRTRSASRGAFGIAFLIVNVMQLALSTTGARGDRDLLTAILRVAPSALTGAALIIAAGFVDGEEPNAVWLAAIVVGFFGPASPELSGWRVEPAHFVERHGLIVIIAIGESLVAIGLGAGVGLATGVIVAAVLGFVVGRRLAGLLRLLPIRGQQLLMHRSGVQLHRLALRRLHLSAPADGGRHRPLRVLDEDDARTCR